MVPAHRDPAGQFDLAVDIGFSQFVAMMSAVAHAGKCCASFWAKRRIAQESSGSGFTRLGEASAAQFFFAMITFASSENAGATEISNHLADYPVRRPANARCRASTSGRWRRAAFRPRKPRSRSVLPGFEHSVSLSSRERSKERMISPRVMMPTRLPFFVAEQCALARANERVAAGDASGETR